MSKQELLLKVGGPVAVIALGLLACAFKITEGHDVVVAGIALATAAGGREALRTN